MFLKILGIYYYSLVRSASSCKGFGAQQSKWIQKIRFEIYFYNLNYNFAKKHLFVTTT